MPMWRFQPYGTPSVHLNEHTNAEAGPSTLTSLLVPCVAPITRYPSGGISEATADAENDQTVAEEEAPVSNSCYSYIPHVSE